MAADILVVGAGHNGLACAAYLARAGHRVTVLEARGSPGGCASTVDAIGARVNICNCDHTMILASGVLADLDLAAHGLRYLDVDPLEVAIGWGDEPPFVQHRSIERTVEELARTSPDAARAYRRYVDATLPLARLVLAAAAQPPSFGGLLRLARRTDARTAARLLSWRRRSLFDVLRSFGLPPWIQAAFATTGPGVWGVSPAAPGTGMAAVGPVVRHLAGVGRPAGGSGALPAALASVVTANGGAVRTGMPVAGLVVEGGAVRGVRLSDGTDLAAGTVVCAVDPRTVLVDWLPPGLRRRPGPVPDGYESKVDAVVAAPPVWRALPTADHVATTVVSPVPGRQAAGVTDRVSDPPMFLVNVPSVLDASMRPPGGGHVLSLEVLWTPYALPGGWHGSPEPRRWLARLASLAEPGFLDGVGEWRVMTPEDYERDFGLRRGYAPSFAGGPLSALLARDRALTRYTTPVRGLFLTGAGTFPGAGVWAASGRNAAHAVLSHLGER
jgi:phytoene dehydrogenase-like protein